MSAVFWRRAGREVRSKGNSKKEKKGSVVLRNMDEHRPLSETERTGDKERRDNIEGEEEAHGELKEVVSGLFFCLAVGLIAWWCLRWVVCVFVSRLSLSSSSRAPILFRVGSSTSSDYNCLPTLNTCCLASALTWLEKNGKGDSAPGSFRQKRHFALLTRAKNENASVGVLEGGLSAFFSREVPKANTSFLSSFLFPSHFISPS